MNYYNKALLVPVIAITVMLGACSQQVVPEAGDGANNGSTTGNNTSTTAGAGNNSQSSGSSTSGTGYGSGGGVTSTGTNGGATGHGGKKGSDYYQGGGSSAHGAGVYKETYTIADLNNPRSLLSKRVIYFDYDQSTIQPKYKTILKAHSEFLKRNGGVNARLEGHADERGTREYNIALSEKRSNTVQWFMRGKGAKSSQTETIAYGEERPIVAGDGEKSWAKNRRVELKYPGH